MTVMGFVAARWRRGDLGTLDEWGLGGRRFGTVVTWFLLGGDLYTAYTFIAVPALVFGAGAQGFFALPLQGLRSTPTRRLWALATNLVVAVALTAVLRAIGAGDSADETVLDDYEERDPTVGTRPLPATPEQERLAGPAGA